MEKVVCNLNMKASRRDDGLLFEGDCKFAGTMTDKAYVLAAMIDWLAVEDEAVLPLLLEAAMIRRDVPRELKKVVLNMGRHGSR